MQVKTDDPRLAAAHLTLDEFVGCVEVEGDLSMPHLLIELHQNENSWEDCPDVPLLKPQPGYSLRCKIPSESHEVFLLYQGSVVGVFVEADSLAVLSEHQGKNLGSELILAAFAQKPWNTPSRKASPAGQKALQKAHSLIC